MTKTKLLATLAGTAFVATTLHPGVAHGDATTSGPAIVYGGGDGHVRFRGGTDISIAIGAETDAKGYVSGQVAQTNLPDKKNTSTDPNPTGTMHGDVKCLAVYGNQVYMSVKLRTRTGFWASDRYTWAEYLITDNVSAPDTISSQPLVAAPNRKIDRPCHFSAQDYYTLTEGDIVVVPTGGPQ